MEGSAGEMRHMFDTGEDGEGGEAEGGREGVSQQDMCSC